MSISAQLQRDIAEKCDRFIGDMENKLRLYRSICNQVNRSGSFQNVDDGTFELMLEMLNVRNAQKQHSITLGRLRQRVVLEVEAARNNNNVVSSPTQQRMAQLVQPIITPRRRQQPVRTIRRTMGDGDRVVRPFPQLADIPIQTSSSSSTSTSSCQVDVQCATWGCDTTEGYVSFPDPCVHVVCLPCFRQMCSAADDTSSAFVRCPLCNESRDKNLLPIEGGVKRSRNNEIVYVLYGDSDEDSD